MRVCTHPDPFVLINTPHQLVFQRSLRELQYHADMMDLFGLGKEHKIQVHLGGVYNDKGLSLKRFVQRYRLLPKEILQRLVIENDAHLYSLKDCLLVWRLTGVPIVADFFHYELNNDGEKFINLLEKIKQTWSVADGPPTVDYASQKPAARAGAHAQAIDLNHFARFFKSLKDLDLDVMMEVKDKEKSALKALGFVSHELSSLNKKDYRTFEGK